MKLGQWIGLLGLVSILYVLWQIRQMLLLLFAAIVLANSLNLLVQWLQQRKIKRSVAVSLSIGCFFTIMAGFFWLIVPPLETQVEELIVLFPIGVNRVDGWLEQNINLVPEQFRSYAPTLERIGQQLQPFLNQILGRSIPVFSALVGIAINTLLVFVLALMLIIDPSPYRRLAIRLFPSFYRRRADATLNECGEALGRWMEAALISMSVIAVLSSLGLFVLGIRAALAQGVLAGLLNFIPNIGPTMSVVFPTAIALLDAPWKSVAVLIFYILVQLFESNLLTPYIMAQHAALLPAVTLLAQIFFAVMFGPLGLALAIPLTVVGQIWIRNILFEDLLDQWKHSE
ncbi:MAG: AI-2E family transporter [Leptolyngbya sp. UWPOB_LEPTO1]|uniref:AI-2E family transporter n=1 Tax=Leptolyngbya sp. UWPOB_LEPTO1 TaxID=2815653 RepID=UPI001AC050B5|nr:AI-2E family transporter [Leptolyngbya sp. UWPOB_LEPTO1]MBN8560181.1 AI-2E family transporter [Leptolyngbya sp. UWPOB_LEPTO1]